jgi:PAS domain S-box-containing protein
MDRLLKRALGMVAKAVGAEDGVIMALDPLSDGLVTQAALNPSMLYEGDEERMTHPAEKLGTWLLFSEEQVVTVDDLLEFEHWDPSIPNAEGWRSALAVVLESNENDPQGVMVMLSKNTKMFGEPQLRLMVAAANQVASAINNADLYHLIRDQAERLGSLLRAEQEEAEKNSAILESIADGVILSDAQGRIILFNSAAERILQLPREQVLGQPLSKFTGLYGGAVADWAETIQNRMATPDLDMIGEYIDNRLQLGEHIVSAHLSPVFTGDKFLGMVSVFRDITRDVEVDRMKGEFVASVSHELRTPLTPIKGYTDLLLMGAAGEVNDAQKRVLSTIKENVDRLTVLVEDVLDISKIDTGKERLKLEPVNIGELLHNIMNTMSQRSTHQRKELAISVNVNDDIPPVQADRDKLTRVISNLIDNAFNYTLTGGSIDVSARLQPDKRRVLIAIKDSGVGIPEHFREDVWRRFQRYEEHALKLEVPGTGLGLAIVKEMVEMHSGDVWFESEVEKGTTFYVSLPVDQADGVHTTRTTQTGVLRQITEE